MNSAPAVRLSGATGSGCAGLTPDQAVVVATVGLADVATTPSSHPTVETSSAAPPHSVRIFFVAPNIIRFLRPPRGAGHG
ncbi:hypothetical protein BST31_06945 [Mycobacterium marseillense]|nr:hypothetical protein BST31_06945 [Mycobacterium marseillense]